MTPPELLRFWRWYLSFYVPLMVAYVGLMSVHDWLAAVGCAAAAAAVSLVAFIHVVRKLRS